MHRNVTPWLVLFMFVSSGCELATDLDLPSGFLEETASTGSELTGTWIGYSLSSDPISPTYAPAGTWRITERADGTLTVSAVSVTAEQHDDPGRVIVLAGTGQILEVHGRRFGVFRGHLHVQSPTIDPTAPDPASEREAQSLSSLVKIDAQDDFVRVHFATMAAPVWERALRRHRVRFDFESNRLVIHGPHDRLAEMLMKEGDKLFPTGTILVRSPKPPLRQAHDDASPPE